MLIVPVEEAQAGMVLAAPVTHPEHPEQELLKSGFILNDQVVARLRDLSVSCIYVNFPGFDDLDRHLAANMSPARQKIYSQIKQTIHSGQRRTRPGVGFSEYKDSMREMITTLVSQGQHPVYIEHMSRLGTDAVTHATAVAHLGLLLGLKMQMYVIDQRNRLPIQHAKEIVNVGVAGMLHDIGKLSLERELQHFNVAAQPQERQPCDDWRNHARLGYEMVRHDVEASAASAVLNHHQRWDGEGFPAIVAHDGSSIRFSQRQIHIFARIVAAADLYDRLATRLDSPARRSNLEVHHLLRTKYSGWLDPVVMEGLLSITPPYPPGSTVGLSDGTSAIVVEVDPKSPYQPLVKRREADGKGFSPERTDLRKPAMPGVTHLGKIAVDKYLPGATPTHSRAMEDPEAESAAVAADVTQAMWRV